MRILFEYLEEKNSRSVKSAISIFISKHKLWGDNPQVLPSSSFLNDYCRKNLADEFIDKKGLFNGYTPTKDVSEEVARLDIIEYVDLIIPRYYYIKREKNNPKNKKKSAERIRNSYQGIEDVEGLLFNIEDNYEREKEYIVERNSTIPLNMKEFNDLNYPYKKFSDEQLMQILHKDCYEKDMILIPEKEQNLKRTEMLRIIHYLYKGRPFANIDKYLMTFDDYKEKYDKDLSHCFINTNIIKPGDIVTFIDYSTEMEILGGYYGNDFINIGQAYKYNEDNDEWKIDWVDMGLSEWTHSKGLRVLNPNIEPIRTICENLFKEDIFKNYYYEEIEKYINIGNYNLTREESLIFNDGKIMNHRNKPMKTRLEKEIRSHNVYSHKRSDNIREYYLVEVSKENPPVYLIGYSTSSNIHETVSNIYKEIMYLNRTEEEKLFDEYEIAKRDNIINFFYEEDYDTFTKRRYPTIKQLYFISDLLNLSYKNLKDIEAHTVKQSFYKCEYTSKHYLKPKSSFKKLNGYYDVAVFIDNLKELVYTDSDAKLKFLKQYFEI